MDLRRRWAIPLLFVLLAGASEAATVEVPFNAAGPSAIAVNPATRKVYVVDQARDEVIVIDGNAHTVIGGIPVADFPTAIALDPIERSRLDGSKSYFLYVVHAPDATPGSVSVISETDMAVVATAGVGGAPFDVALNAPDNRVFVPNSRDGTLSIFNSSFLTGSTPRLERLATLPVGANPLRVEVDPTQDLAYVASPGTLTVVAKTSSPAGFQVGGTIDIRDQGGMPDFPALAVNTATRKLYVGLLASGELIVLDGVTRQVLQHIDLIDLGGSSAGGGPIDLAVNPTTSDVFASMLHEGAVWMFNGVSDSLESVHPVGGASGPTGPPLSLGLSVDPTTSHVFALSRERGSNRAAVIDFEDPGMGSDLISVPVRWCVIEGAMAAAGQSGKSFLASNGRDCVATCPANVGNATANGAVIGHLKAVSDGIWLPQGSRLAFRAAEVPAVPILRDPRPPSAIERLGDLSSASHEVDEAWDACRCAWQACYGAHGGLIAVFARQVIGMGAAYATGAPGPLRKTARLCQSPRGLNESDLLGQSLAVGEVTAFGLQVSLAHELGHTLFLSHGNGLDDDRDGSEPPAPGPRLYDEYCDDETAAGAGDLMNGAGAPGNTRLRPLQTETARDAARLVRGATTGMPDPTGEFVRRPDCESVACTLPPDLVMTRLGVAESPSAATTTFSHALGGPFSASARQEYAMFADLDANDATGCAPAGLGFPTSLSGAEVATLVTVHRLGGALIATPAAWVCDEGAFGAAGEESLQAVAFEQVEAESGATLNGLVALTMPSVLLGPAGPNVRVQALARQLSPGGLLDRVPDALEGGVAIDLVPPAPAECEATPRVADLGAPVHVEIRGLTPERVVELSLGEQLVAEGATDSNGQAGLDFAVPAITRPGLRLLTAAAQGTAVTAGCVLRVDRVADGAFAACGNGLLETGEPCDDANLLDGDGCSALCLVENQPPQCAGASATPPTLWPPDHELRAVTIEGVSDPDGGQVSLAITGILQDEPVDDVGDGSTAPDAFGTGSDAAQVRSERQGGGDGRVYALRFEATDERGGACTGTVTVCVPHSGGKKDARCTGQGPLFDSTTSASAALEVPGPRCGLLGIEALVGVAVLWKRIRRRAARVSINKQMR